MPLLPPEVENGLKSSFRQNLWYFEWKQLEINHELLTKGLVLFLVAIVWLYEKCLWMSLNEDLEEIIL